MGKDIIWGS